MIVGLMLVSALAGRYANRLVENIPKWKELKIQRAVQKEFKLKQNEYALEYDATNNRYLVTTMAHEYGVKLSSKEPLTIVKIEEY